MFQLVRRHRLNRRDMNRLTGGHPVRRHRLGRRDVNCLWINRRVLPPPSQSMMARRRLRSIPHEPRVEGGPWWRAMPDILSTTHSSATSPGPTKNDQAGSLKTNFSLLLDGWGRNLKKHTAGSFVGRSPSVTIHTQEQRTGRSNSSKSFNKGKPLHQIQSRQGSKPK